MAELFDGIWWSGYVWPTILTVLLIVAIMVPVLILSIAAMGLLPSSV